MDLKAFVSTTLTQILDGIRDAQSHPNGGHIAADGYISNHSNLVSGGSSGFFTIVDFDVSVAAATTDSGQTVRVAGVEREDASQKAFSNLSRIKFSVHLRLPKGGDNADKTNYGGSHYDIDYPIESNF